MPLLPPFAAVILKNCPVVGPKKRIMLSYLILSTGVPQELGGVAGAVFPATCLRVISSLWRVKSNILESVIWYGKRVFSI